MYNDHRSSYHHHHHQRILPSSTSSLSSTSAISDFRNIKFTNIHHSHHLSSLTPSLSNERLNSSTLNRGKDGIFRPKSIFSLATEIDFDSSSSKLLTRSTARPTIPSSNPRLSYLRDHQGRNSQSLSTSTSTRSQDFLTNFNDNLSYLNTTNTNSKTKYNQNFYNKNSYILPGNYRFTNVYNAPKYRERPLLSNLNRKFGSPSSSTTFNHRNDRRQSGGGGSSGKGSPIPSSSRHLGKESPTGSIGSTHKSSSSSINDNQSSPSSSLKPKLERNKFLIKFREYDKPPLIIDNNRRSSISWDIPYDHQQLNQPKIDSKQKSNIESIKEIDDVVVVDDDSFNQQQELGVKQIDDMSFMNRTNIIDDGGSGNVIEQQTKSLTPCSLQRWKGSFNLNDDNNGGKDDNNNNLVDDDDKFKNNHLDKFVDLNSLIKEEKQNQEPILLKESLLSTVTTATKIIENQTNEFPERLISLKAMDLIKPKSKINDSNVEQKPVKKPMKKPLKKDPNDQIRIMKKSEKPKPKRTNSLKLSDSSLMKENLIFKTQIDIPSFNDEIIEIKFDKLLTNFDSNNERKFAKQLKKSATSELSLSKTIKDLDDVPVMIGKRKKQPKPINDKMMVDKKSNLEMENDEPKITTVVQNIPKIKIIPEKLDLTTPTESKDEKTKKTTTTDKQVVEKLEKQSDLKTKAKIIKKDDADKSVTSPEIKSPELKSPKLKPKKDQKSETIEQSKFSFNKCNSFEESIVSKVESIVSPPSLPPSSPKSPKIQSSNDEEIIKIKRTKSKSKKSSDQQQQQQSKNNNNNEDSKCQLSNENEIINKDNNKTSASSSLTLQKTSADDNDDNQPKQQQQSDKKKKKKPIKTSKNEKAILNETENVITKLLPSPPPAKQQELRITKSVENESNHQQQISSSLSSSTSLQTKSSSKTITDTNLLSPPTKIKINQQLYPFQQNNDNNRQRRQQRIRFREYCIDDFRFLTVLGRGSFGKVLLAELITNYDYCYYFAIKCLKKQTIIEDDDVESIMIERKVLALGTSHPFICKLFCTFQTESHLFFAMELCSGGDLMFHVQKEGKFSENKAKFYASEMICALWFLHKRSIIYRDLKLDNVMIANDGHIRLVDFGMCVGKMYREEFLPSNFCGTPEYMAPEIIKGIKYNHSVDYWALGVVIYEMLVGTSPFNGTDEDELLWNVCNTEVHYPKFLSEQVKNLIVLLLKKNPQERLGLPNSPSGEIVQQQWFHGIQWDSVEKCQLKPPFIPKLAHDADVSYFDQYFTKEIPCITPCEKLINDNDQLLFQGFNYTNHRMTE